MWWLERVVRQQERRGYAFASVLAFAAFVGGARLAEEWALGRCSVRDTLGRLLAYTSFYLLAFFTYTCAVQLVVRQPWQQTIQVVRVGIFCGVLPPLVDLLLAGPATRCYAYAPLWTWPPGIYDPAQRLTAGEAGVLWFTVALCAAYVHLRTGSWGRALVGAAAGYGAVLVNMSLLYSVALVAVPALGGEPVGHHLVHLQMATLTALLLVLQPRLAWGLLSRLAHALPFGAMFLVGAAFAAPLGARVLLQALLPVLAFLVAIAQNDLYDQEDDAPQGRPRYLDRDDVAVLETVLLVCALNQVQVRSMLGPGLLVFFAASFLYNHPSYRGRSAFPANLKIEGVWGASACFLGLVAALESPLGLREERLPQVRADQIGEVFDPAALALVALVFGGWSLVAALKDYKDVRADLRAHVHTVYTLAWRRGWGLRRVHRALVGATCLALLVPFPALWLLGRAPAWTVVFGLAASGALGWAMSSAPSARRFEWALGVLTTTLLLVAAVLARTIGGGPG